MNSPLTKDEVTAFAGKNADYYWTRWTPLIQGQDWSGFNWAAFLLSGLWLAYRKMYGIALIFYAVALLGVFADQMRDERTERLQSWVPWLIAALCGGYGNRWYWSHATRLIDQLRVQQTGEGIPEGLLAKHGGTSILSAVAFFGLFMALAWLIILRIH